MKTTKKIALVLGLSSFAGMSLLARPIITVDVPAPAVTVQVPAPAVTVEAAVPDTYVWDGYEYVGVVGGQYYYLGPDHIWLTLDAHRIARFHDWEHAHANWRDHATRNELYRRDAHGHDVPRHDAAPVHDDHVDHHDNNGHDAGHDKDKDRDH